MRAGRLRNRANRYGAGSALILTVVLTALLAIVGVLFVMVTRIDKMGTQAVSQNRELTLATQTVVAEISELLAQDVPGGLRTEEYYDYPDAVNDWLADLEPYRDANDVLRWRQISSITGAAAWKRDVLITVIGERDPIVDVNVADVNEAVTNADADGDGVGDAQWFEVPGIMTSKGRPVYAAVRIIDNGGMLNVNTGYWFDPNRADPSFANPNITDPSPVDGSSPLQINAIALAGGHAVDPARGQTIAETLLEARRIPLGDPNALSRYEQRVLWGYLRPDPCGLHTPFDLSDELELRYRGLLNHGRVNTRVETWGRFKANTISTPVDFGGQELENWFARAHDTGVLDLNYAFRHVTTTYNMDRVITPSSVGTLGKMVNVNNASPDEIHGAIVAALAGTGRDPAIIYAEAAQITANLVDYIDDDDTVTAIDGIGVSGDRYHGFEQPCIYISEIAHNAVTDGGGVVHHSYAVELFKPYFEDRDPADDQWRLVIKTASVDDIVQSIEWSGLRRFHVLLAEDPLAELFDDGDFDDPNEPLDAATRYNYERSYSNPTAQVLDPQEFTFAEGSSFDLQRFVSRTGEWLTVDYVMVARDGWMAPDQGPRSTQRDISLHKCRRRLWTPTGVTPVVLGRGSGQYVDPNDERVIQAHPINRTLRNIGELGMVFADSAYGVMPNDTAEQVLLNLMDPAYAELFNYLTVVDPAQHGHPASETRIMGRINVNTAPWFVLAQLPWIQYQDPNETKSTRARAIVDYRDANGPFENIGGLMQVTALRDLASDGLDNLNDEDPRGPDLTRDSARDDLEERDLLFTRMSNLVTVRSDVFTAYILVRLGANGPQKRMMAILDRSETNDQNPSVRIVALHPVADPR